MYPTKTLGLAESPYLRAPQLDSLCHRSRKTIDYLGTGVRIFTGLAIGLGVNFYLHETGSCEVHSQCSISKNPYS